MVPVGVVAQPGDILDRCADVHHRSILETPDDRHQPWRGSLLVHRHVEGAVFVHPLRRVGLALHLLMEVAQPARAPPPRGSAPPGAWRAARGAGGSRRSREARHRSTPRRRRRGGGRTGSAPRRRGRAAPRAPAWCSLRALWPVPPGPAGCPPGMSPLRMARRSTSRTYSWAVCRVAEKLCPARPGSLSTTESVTSVLSPLTSCIL